MRYRFFSGLADQSDKARMDIDELKEALFNELALKRAEELLYRLD